MRCPCGYDQFGTRTRVARAEKATRYVPADEATRRGLGSVLLGTAMGVGTASYGKLELTISTGYLETVCLSCHRSRRKTPIGGGAVLGSWREGREIYMLMSDVQDPACASARLLGHATRLDLSVTVDVEATIPELGSASSTVPTLPTGAVVGDTVYRVTLPEDLGDGDYSLVLQDKCLGVTTPVMTVHVGEIEPEPEPEPVVVSTRTILILWYIMDNAPEAYQRPDNYEVVDQAIEAAVGSASPVAAEMNDSIPNSAQSIKPLFLTGVVLPINPNGLATSAVVWVTQWFTKQERTFSDGTVSTEYTTPSAILAQGQVVDVIEYHHPEPIEAPPDPAYSPVDPTSWGQWLLTTPPDTRYSVAGSERSERTSRDFYYRTWDLDDLVQNGHYVPHPSRYDWQTSGGNQLNRQVEGIAGANSFRYGNPPLTLAWRAKVGSLSNYVNMLGETHLTGAGAGATVYYFLRPDGRVGMTHFQYAGSGPQPTKRMAPNLTWPDFDRWHYCSFRYDPTTNIIRFGIDDAFEDIATPLVMLPPDNTRLELRASNGFGFDVDPFVEPDASLADLGAWQRYLTDEEIVALATSVLGAIPGGGAG